MAFLSYHHVDIMDKKNLSYVDFYIKNISFLKVFETSYYKNSFGHEYDEGLEFDYEDITFPSLRDAQKDAESSRKAGRYFTIREKLFFYIETNGPSFVVKNMKELFNNDTILNYYNSKLKHSDIYSKNKISSVKFIFELALYALFRNNIRLESYIIENPRTLPLQIYDTHPSSMFFYSSQNNGPKYPLGWSKSEYPIKNNDHLSQFINLIKSELK
ncbi:hypothetical protein [Mailhella sp.]